MERLPHNEMISAYLDGELTADQRAEVEAELAANPAARRLADQLRAVREAVRSLPRARLGEDLTADVLRIAERRMLSETPPPADDSPQPLSSRPIVRRLLTRRIVAWAGAAVAIALLLMLSEPKRDARHPNQDQARAPQQAEPRPRPAQPAPPMVPTLEPMPGRSQLAESREPGTAARRGGEGGIQAAAPSAVTQPDRQAVLLVKCYVRPEAAKQNQLDRLLAQQRVVRDRTERLIAAAAEQLKERIGQPAPAGLEPVGQTTLIYAEPKPEQIERTLAALAARAEEFPAILVEGEKAPQQWTRYSRRPGQQAESSKSSPPAPAEDAAKKQPVLFLVQPVK